MRWPTSDQLVLMFGGGLLSGAVASALARPFLTPNEVEAVGFAAVVATQAAVLYHFGSKPPKPEPPPNPPEGDAT